MSFQRIQGQDSAKKLLRNSLRHNQLSHAYMIQGPTGIGKKQVALVFAQAILCNEEIDDACGQCISCRMVENYNHEDVTWIQPDGQHIKIEQIRDLQKRLSFRISSTQTKIYVIEQAELLTNQAANSLLKFLEEPGIQVIAILLTSNEYALPPTIRSRTQLVRLTPLGALDMIPQLVEEGFSLPLVQTAVHLASGLDSAREMIQLNGFAEMRKVVIQLAREALSSPAHAMITLQQHWTKNQLAEQVDLLFDLFVLWFKDLIMIQAGQADRIVFSDEKTWLTSNAFSKQSGNWIYCMEQAIEAKKRLRYNANAQATVERYFIQLGT